MSKETKSLIVVTVTLVLLFATTLLLDLDWVQRRTVRPVLVYLLMALQLFVGWRNLKEINKVNP